MSAIPSRAGCLSSTFSASPWSFSRGVSWPGHGATSAGRPPRSRYAMWNKDLIARARVYASAVLTLVEPSGYPLSQRCTVQFDEAHEVITFPEPPALARGYQGRVSLLFHRHNEVLEDFYEVLIKGTLAVNGDRLVFQPEEFLTGTGSAKTDQMPHAQDPIQLVQFMLLGRRKAKEYIAKRGQPWPPIVFDRLIQALNEK